MLVEIQKQDYKEYFRLLHLLNNMKNDYYTSQDFWGKYEVMKEKNNCIIYVYKIYNVIIGIVKVTTEIKFFDNIVHIDDLVVDPTFRGKGYGRKIIKEVLQNIPQCYKVILQCKPELVNFYEKCGFNNEGNNMCLRISLKRF